VLGPLDCKIVSKLAAWSTCLVDVGTAPPEFDIQLRAPRDTEGDLTFNLNGELLHGGQDQNNALVIDNCEHIPARDLDIHQCTVNSLEGLNPPQIKEMGEGIQGDNRKIMHKENKQRC
jgi:hypothetical protein